MEPVTNEQVVQAIKDRKFLSWIIRECSICNSPLRYLFAPDLQDPNKPHVAFNGTCNCSRFPNDIRRRSIEDLTAHFNMQTPEIREKIWKEFTCQTV